MTMTPMSMRSCALRASRTGATTASPRERSTRTTALPTKPFAPEIQMRRGPDGWRISRLLFEILWGERRTDSTGYLNEVGGRGPVVQTAADLT